MVTTLNAANQLTILEMAKRTRNGNLIKIAEVMNRKNAINKDAPWFPCNDGTGHIITRRTSLPAGSFRSYNEGVSRETSQTKQIREVTGLLEGLSKVDYKLVNNSGNAEQFRSSEDLAFVEGLSQTQATNLIYGNHVTDPKEPEGLAPRLNATSQDMVMDGGSDSADACTSIYVVQWGRKAAHLIHPPDSMAGIDIKNLGVQLALDDNDREYLAYVTDFSIQFGLAVHDDRCIGRYANIATTGSSNIFDEDKLIELINNFESEGEGCVIYVNKTVKTQMDINAKDKTNVNYGVENIWGVPTLVFRGVPVRRCDAIVSTEAAID